MADETKKDPGSEKPADGPETAKEPSEMVICAVSKQEVPLDETIELERKKGEKLRIHSRFKKF